MKYNTFTSGTLFDLFCILYVDNGEFTFEPKTDIERGIALLSDHFDRFGLKINIGAGKNPSKTEYIFFPPPGFSNTCTSPPTNPNKSTL